MLLIHMVSCYSASVSRCIISVDVLKKLHSLLTLAYTVLGSAPLLTKNVHAIFFMNVVSLLPNKSAM